MVRHLAMAFALLIGAGVSATSAHAERVTGTGTLVMKDKFHSQTAWGSGLDLPRDGRVVRVMDGNYGFAVKTAAGKDVADFLFPQQAVGLSLPAGQYLLVPYVCSGHRHHHVEVTAEY